MNPVVVVLLAVMIGAETVAVVGMVIADDRFVRLHYAAAATTVGPLALALATLADRGLDGVSVRVCLIALTLMASGPITTHALARAFGYRDGKVADQLEGGNP